MKKQNFKQYFISLFVLVLVLNSIPIKGIAEDNTTTHINEVTNDSPTMEIGEIIEQRTENSKDYYNGNGSYTKKIFFEPIHTKEDGQYEEISADLTPNQQNSNLIETENTKLKTNFLTKMENGKYATFEYKNHLIEFSILEASGNGVDSTKVNDSEATYKTEDNQLFYKEIFPKIDLRNFTFNQNSKEDIILNSYEGFHKFTFQIKTELKAVKSDDTSISFVDDDEKEIFNLPAPIMTDSNYDEHLGEGVSSNDVTYSLVKIDGGYQLIVNADPNWLEDPARKYPVFIDPTTSISISTDTYVSNLEPTKNYEDPASKWSEALGEYVLPVGYYGTTTGTNYALLKNPIASIQGLNIDRATFYAYVTHHYYASPTPNGIWLDRNDTDFSPNSVTWNTKPSSTNIASDSVGINQWAAFNVTSTVKGWADGSIPNYGFKLHTNGNGQTYWKKIVSSANATNKPYLSIAYTIPVPNPPKSKVYTNSDGTGYIDLSWEKVKGATGYSVWIFNGVSYEEFPVQGDGNTTSWSTKNKKIWPKVSGRYQLHHDDGLGSELPVNPSNVYKYSGGNYPTARHYWFRISTKYQLGESTRSLPSTPAILPLPNAPSGKIYSNTVEGIDGYAELNWDPIPGASGYKVWLYNGTKYEAIDVGNVTSWSTKGKGIWPTSTEIANATPTKLMFHTDGTGNDLPKEPFKLYEKMGTGYATSKNFFFRLSAYNTNGETVYSQSSLSQPMLNSLKILDTPKNFTGFSDYITDNEGYFNLSWDAVPNASGYMVWIYNGKEYQGFDVKNVTNWSTKDKGIWLTDQEISAGKYQLHTDGLGRNLTDEPFAVYRNVNSDYENYLNYFFKISAYDNSGNISSYSEIYKPTLLSISDEGEFTSGDVITEDDLSAEDLQTIQQLEEEELANPEPEIEQFLVDESKMDAEGNVILDENSFIINPEYEPSYIEEPSDYLIDSTEINTDNLSPSMQIASFAAPLSSTPTTLRGMSRANALKALINGAKKALLKKDGSNKTSKTVNVANYSKLTDYLKNYKTKTLSYNSRKYNITKDDMKHFLGRHHTGFWNGSWSPNGQPQTFFRPNTGYGSIETIISKVLDAHGKKVAPGARKFDQFEAKVDGIDYVVGINFETGRITQFFPRQTYIKN